MRKEDIKKSFDNVNPSSMSTEKMLNKVLNHADKEEKVSFIKSLNLKKVIPAAAMVCVLIVGVMNYDYFIDKPISDIETGRLTGDDLAREDMAIEIKDQFKIDNREYMLLSDWHREEFNLPSTISEDNIGEKITTITTSIDSELIGLDVYEYIPAGGEVIVAVKKDSQYQLYKFLNFDSYNNNKDEDANTYLKLYGINSPSDIAKIQVLGHGEDAKLRGVMDIKGEITDIDTITKFYNFYSVIKDSSDKYFDKLFNHRRSINNTPSEPRELPPDYNAPDVDLPDDTPITDEAKPPTIDLVPLPGPGVDDGKATRDLGPGEGTRDSSQSPIIDRGETKPQDRIEDKGHERPADRRDQGQSSEPSQGSAGNALMDSVTIRIYNQQGIYFEAPYYPNIGFISRHEVNAEFANFLEGYIK